MKGTKETTWKTLSISDDIATVVWDKFGFEKVAEVQVCYV